MARGKYESPRSHRSILGVIIVILLVAILGVGIAILVRSIQNPPEPTLPPVVEEATPATSQATEETSEETTEATTEETTVETTTEITAETTEIVTVLFVTTTATETVAPETTAETTAATTAETTAAITTETTTAVETTAPEENKFMPSVLSGEYTYNNGSEPVIEVVDGVTYVNGILIANKTYSLPEDFNPGGLHPDAKAAFDAMQAAAAAEGITLKIISGYRSYAQQTKTYGNYVARDGKEEADRIAAQIVIR